MQQPGGHTATPGRAGKGRKDQVGRDQPAEHVIHHVRREWELVPFPNSTLYARAGQKVNGPAMSPSLLLFFLQRR